MKKLIAIYIITTLFLGANLAYCLIKVEQLEAASKAAWYELDQHRMKINKLEGK